MSERNTIYDAAGSIVGSFRHGVAWSKEPRVRLGEYDYGDEGSIYDNSGEVVARFNRGCVTTVAGVEVGRFLEVPFTEMSNTADERLNGSLVKRLEIGSSVIGWCIGNAGAACAAIYFLFSDATKQPPNPTFQWTAAPPLN